jgi:hypothetical protein
MKTLKITIVSAIVLLLSINVSSAQNKMQAYSVHLDHVRPSMLLVYENLERELISQSKKYDSNFGWIALVSDDFDYYYVSPIKNMAQLDSNPFAALSEKMGEGELGKLFNKMDKCYDDHVNYTLILDTELSYMPDGMTQTPEGQPFRKNTLYYFTPENYEAAEALAKDFKALYALKGSKVHYRIYRSGYGADGTYFMVAIAAKNGEEYEKMSTENQTLLGEEGNQLVGRLLNLMSNMKTVTGSIRSDLSYAPEK